MTILGEGDIPSKPSIHNLQKEEKKKKKKIHRQTSKTAAFSHSGQKFTYFLLKNHTKKYLFVCNSTVNICSATLKMIHSNCESVRKF